MKTFDQLTEEEKVGLTTEQVQYYARLGCANRGIIIPQKPISQVQSVTPATEKYYVVGYESFAFSTEADAQNYIDSKAKSFRILEVITTIRINMLVFQWKTTKKLKQLFYIQKKKLLN
jgi:hypothetical protein